MLTNIKKRNELRKKNGLRVIPDGSFSLAKVLFNNWDSYFIYLMQNRMLFGFFRYGTMKDNACYDNVGSIEKRIKLYRKTGNTEILVDIANIAMCEFNNGIHPKKHFKSIDDGIHTKRRIR